MRRAAAALLALFAVLPAAAQDFDLDTLDLPALIECRKTVPDYNSFALWMSMTPGALIALGWAETGSGGNVYLRQFHMGDAVEAFGHVSNTIVFTATGPMLVLDGVQARALASELGLATFYSQGDKFLAEKVVFEAEEKDGSLTARSRIAINVSTVASHPGQVLAGCSYTLEIG